MKQGSSIFMQVNNVRIENLMRELEIMKMQSNPDNKNIANETQYVIRGLTKQISSLSAYIFELESEVKKINDMLKESDGMETK
jgi:DNA helicase IV